MNLSIATSTTADGPMKLPGLDWDKMLPTRATFLANNNIDPQDTTLICVTYETMDFCRYITVGSIDKGDGITRNSTFIADALVVTEPNHALFLPLADCIAAVIHDPSKNILMVSHLGRQNLEQTGGTKCIEYLVRHHGSKPSELTVWLSPAAGNDNYPLFSFDNRSLHDVATEQLHAAGIQLAAITASPIDTTTDLAYYSHSQFLAGNRPTDGRHAVVAVMN